MTSLTCSFFFFFFNDTATTEIYTLSLHDALPISPAAVRRARPARDHAPCGPRARRRAPASHRPPRDRRSEEHTSELQSRLHLVCRLLLEKKNHHSTSGATSLHHRDVPAREKDFRP